MTDQPHFDLNDLDGPAWVRLAGGTFEMGSETGRDDTRPVHQVRLSAFCISRSPITNAQYAGFVEETGRKPPEHWSGGEAPAGLLDHPVTFVSWHDAQAFCDWLSEKSGPRVEGGARLPTEAEWEFAACGTDGREYPWGAERPTALHANFQESGIDDTTEIGAHPVGATPDGVQDLAGNVRAWCRDWYGPYSDAPAEDPVGPEDGAERVVRGGAFLDASGTLRGTYRFNTDPDNRFGFIGFRVVWPA